MKDNSLAVIIENELKLLGSTEKAQFLQGFFKTGKGQYAEGDKMLGVVVPEQRKVAKAYYKDCDLKELDDLIESPWHECRLTALLILTLKITKEKDEAKRKAVVDFYLKHLKYVNNWDLVDLSAPHILGKYLLDKDKGLLYTLADSDVMWEQRISIISTLHFIRNNQFDDSIALAKKLVYHKHDLIHKAVGWILREVGKRDEDLEKLFLDEYYQTMPRTALRYAIERFSETDRKYYMSRTK